LGSFRQSLAVDDHEFGAPIRGREMKHSHAHGPFRKGKTVLREQVCNGRSVRRRILDLHRRIIRPTLCVIDELQAADVGSAVGVVIVGISIGREELLKLHPIEALERAAALRFDEQVLFRLGVSVEIDLLSSDLAEVLAKGQGGRR
jgi:hypothetical protein